MKIGDTVYFFEVEILRECAKINETSEQYKIIGLNENRLCIDNKDFKTIKHTKLYNSDSDMIFNNVIICDWLYDSYIKKLYATLYTSNSSNKTAFKRLYKEIQKHVAEKYGVYSEISKAVTNKNAHTAM